MSKEDPNLVASLQQGDATFHTLSILLRDLTEAERLYARHYVVGYYTSANNLNVILDRDTG